MKRNQKRTAVHLYQLCAYKPAEGYIKHTKPHCYEQIGVTYPYRRKEIDLKYFDAFHPDTQK